MKRFAVFLFWLTGYYRIASANAIIFHNATYHVVFNIDLYFYKAIFFLLNTMYD